MPAITPTHRRRDGGIAMVTVLLLLTLSLAMLGGFTTMVITDQRLRSVDRNRTQAFYGAHGALEQLTADLGNLFVSNFAPTGDEVRALATTPPVFDGVSFADPAGGTGYGVDFAVDGSDNPVAENRSITAGPFQGFIGLLTPYTLRVVARTRAGADGASEVELRRTLQTVSIPVFQFGVFSETDLSFFAGPNFGFGGRVHTNGHLFLASGNGTTLTLADRVTAVGEVIRSHLSNGWATSTNYTGTVRAITAPGAYRALTTTEGSLVTSLGSAQNEPTWTNLSVGAYNGNVRNGRTGARQLSLPFVSLGATPVDLIRRGVAAENPLILSQRYYALASVRILLSDRVTDFDGLPGLTGTAPLPLDDLATTPIAGYTVDATHAPFATSQGNAAGIVTSAAVALGAATIPVAPNTTGIAMPGELLLNGVAGARCTGKTLVSFTGCTGVPATGANRAVATNFRSPEGTALLGGVIKIELQQEDRSWQDVTLEWLNLGVAGRNLAVAACGEPAPDAILRLQRLRNAPAGGVAAPAPAGQSCGTGSLNATDYWPNVLYDTREGNRRDDIALGTTTVPLGGVMHYVELDVRNLGRWLRGEIGASGPSARSVNGYTVYFSDRRSNRNAADEETGEYGFEDVVNPADAAGTPNGLLDDGEDVNSNNVVDVYGQTPHVPAGATAPLTAAARPATSVAPAIAQVNRAILFRRALKLTNGSLGDIVAPGLTIASENPVYVQGHYNANSAGFGNPHIAAAVIADAVTLLSSSWNDNNSFSSPHNPAGRDAGTTWYRFAVLAGKGKSFPRPTSFAADQDFGTDGGVHNFLRYLENWGGETLNFRGALASFYFNRQAVGTYKCCTNVYSPPSRGYAFDTDFLQPSLLPPLTPMFRDLNTTGFTQVIR